ncbi:peptidylprolyl isomerase [Sphingomonas sp. AOB5]|uniref:peptidylprolyl isomerase n=1 Tax=Sphingomonas sp. AOB5 TaxID=3034017 RepID=UPI0023F9B91C|nr:peptidylprolyl isomerase [Sphingomonas sp. AOB5]MDF7774309.1 peptidylprolyl isomerase [Sphingomonas sp. AOB5]
MIRRLLALLALTLIAVPAAAQTPATPPTPPAPVRVALETSAGRIVIEVDRAKAPVTAANFLRYVDQKRLDGTVFYRAVRVAPHFGFVQFGVQNAAKRVLPPIRHEPTTQTGLKHLDGSISIARTTPGTARGDFTIMVGDQPSFDADPTKPGDNLGYATFGRVVEGLDVVVKIQESPVAEGGHFKGEMLAPPVRIITARRVP